MSAETLAWGLGIFAVVCMLGILALDRYEMRLERQARQQAKDDQEIIGI